MNKINVVYTHGGSTIPSYDKKKLQYATAWMNLKDIMLNEISQLQKDKYYMTLLI